MYDIGAALLWFRHGHLCDKAIYGGRRVMACHSKHSRDGSSCALLNVSLSYCCCVARISLEPFLALWDVHVGMVFS